MRNIAYLRRAAGLSQEELGNAVGVSQMAVSFWENGKSYPSAAILPKIADVLGCTIDELYASCDLKV